MENFRKQFEEETRKVNEMGEELKSIKDQFWANHEKRMTLLKERNERINETIRQKRKWIKVCLLFFFSSIPQKLKRGRKIKSYLFFFILLSL